MIILSKLPAVLAVAFLLRAAVRGPAVGCETATLTIGSQRDTLRFTPGVTGRTGLTLERGGNAIVKTANTYLALTNS